MEAEIPVSEGSIPTTHDGGGRRETVLTLASVAWAAVWCSCSSPPQWPL